MLNIIIKKKGSYKERKSNDVKAEQLRAYYQREIEQGSRFYAHGMTKTQIKEVLSESSAPEPERRGTES